MLLEELLGVKERCRFPLMHLDICVVDEQISFVCLNYGGELIWCLKKYTHVRCFEVEVARAPA